MTKREEDLKRLNNVVEEAFQNRYKSKVGIAKIDIKSGEVISFYKDENEAAKDMRLSRAASIKEVCKGKRRSAYGYNWKCLFYTYGVA